MILFLEFGQTYAQHILFMASSRFSRRGGRWGAEEVEGFGLHASSCTPSTFGV